MLNITIKDMSKSFGGVRLFDGVNLILPEGRYKLEGVNGAGKSSLLNILFGIELPDSGSIDGCHSFDYVSASLEIPAKLSVLSVFQLYDQYQRSDVRYRECLIELFGLNEVLYQRIESLSTGTLQKLKLLLAFSGNRRWLLLDEAFNGLDVNALRVVTQIIHSGKRPLIYVDHSYGILFKETRRLVIDNKTLCLI